MYPQVALRLCILLEPYLTRQRANSIPVIIQVLVSLRMLATGSYQKVLGQDYFHPVAQSTISRFYYKVLDAIIELEDLFIIFPNTPMKRFLVSQRFVLIQLQIL